MLSRTLRRAIVNTPPTQPLPTFLLPWTATLVTASTSNAIHSSQPSSQSVLPERAQSSTRHGDAAVIDRFTPVKSSSEPVGHAPSSTTLPQPQKSPLSESVRELLPSLQSQGPHYITVHIHGFPYLVTQGDTVRLPFHMPDVETGDILRLNRASIIGSRDFTLKAAAAQQNYKSPTTSTIKVLDPTNGSLASESRIMPHTARASEELAGQAPHFIPHIAKGKRSYLDDRLFVCRATVLGVESEPMRIKEKTKRRQRHVRTIRSKHRYTLIKIKELRVKSLEEIDSSADR